MRKMSLVLLAAGSALFAGLVFAGPQGAGPMGPGFPSARRLGRVLELAPEQQQAVEEIVSAAKPRFQALRESARATRQQLMQANPDDPNYASEVAAASQTSATHAAELVNLAAEVKVQVYTILTAAQKEKASELMATMQQRRGELSEQRGSGSHQRRWGHKRGGSKDCGSSDDAVVG